MTKREWAAIAAQMASFYPHSFKLESTAQVQSWYEALADLPGPLVHAAVMHMVRTKEAFPSIADIRRHAEPQPIAASDAWSEVMRQVGTVGYCGVPSFSDPIIYRAVEALGGWQEVCNAPRKDQPTMRAQFRRAIEEAAEDASRERTFQAMGVEQPKRLDAPAALKDVLPSLPHPAPRDEV